MVKEEVKKFDEEEEEIPDIEQVLQHKKKKIALKLKNYKFSSIHDIFEGRDDQQKNEAIKIDQPAPVDPTKKPPLPTAQKMGASNPPVKKTKVKGFQKKVILQPKRFHEDLEDIRDSDDNQDEALKKLEDLYDKNHRSDIYVTGTLSIVFEKPKHENKMMNINYYHNIHHQEHQDYIQQQLSKEQSQLLDNSQMLNNSRPGTAPGVYTQNNNNNNIYISAFGEPERLESKESLYDNNLSMGSIGNNSVMRSGEISVRNISTHKRAQSQMKASLNASRRSNIPNSGALYGRKRHPLKRTQSGISNSKTQRRDGSTGAQNSTLGKSQMTTQAQIVVQRPEVMTDRQILRRLNNNVKQSRVFQSVNFTKLPDTIKRKDGETRHVKKRAKKKKKKENKLKLEEKEDEDEISDTSQEAEFVQDDYFLDRDVVNIEEVNKAKTGAVNRKIDNVEWSGQDIMTRFDPYKTRIALDSLNTIRIWPHGCYGYFKRWRTLLKKVMKSGLVENLMTLCVFSNTIILSMDHYGIDTGTASVLASFNTFFTIIFAVEMFLKIAAIGIVKWLRDKMNYMDGFIVILSLVELIFMSGSGAFSAFRSIRMLRTLRVLRVARLLRGLKSMINIIQVIQRSLSSFVYLGMLLFLFIFIYALLGMQLFGGNFHYQSTRYTFDSFNQAFVTSFILLSMENWNQVLFNAMGSDVNKAISVIYFISCIFIGNFMLLNLFLAILLDAFTSVDEEDHETPEKKAEKERQKLLALKEKEGEDLINGFEEIEGQPNADGDAKKKKKKKKKKSSSKKGKEPLSNILDESMEADLEALEQRRQELLKQKTILFEGIECERSIYMFTKENKIRIFSYKLVHNNNFENFILILIILSSIKLIFDTYYFSAPSTDPVVVISSKLDLVFTILFTGECVLKVIAFGFIQDQNSYLRETWSQMDFFIVVTSLIDASFSGVNIQIIKILRLLRILRPLRFISHNSSMKTVVIALLSSMGAIFNVGIVVICIFLMFAILGVNLFAGKLQYCSVNKYSIPDKVTCFKNRGEWSTYHQHFDNVIQGMLTLFSVATLEGWPDLMYTYTDITGLEQGPQQDASPYNAYFFVAFVFIGSFFFMNLFVGVLFMNFEAAQRDEKEALLLEGHEIKWTDMMKMITDAKPEIIKIPKNKVSIFMYNLTKAESKFDFFIMICIILNMVQMAMTYEGQTKPYSNGLDYSNYFFTAVFTMECIFKLIGNGSAYFIPGWHKFDFFVVCSSYIDIVMGQLSATSLKFLRVGPQLARVLRVLRVSRLFRLLNKYKGLQALLQTITFSLPSLFNVFALLMLVYFIFSVLSVFMFSTITQGNIIDPIYFNFKNFSQAMIMLLRISTGEDWPTIMYDTMNTDSDCIPNVNCGLSYSPIFFIIFVMIQSYVMLNLFILIILQQFELYYLPNDNILQQFRDDLEKFKLTWNKFSKEFTGIKVRALDLVKFFRDLDGKLGFGKAQESEILRNIVKMNLESDEEGFIYFNELLYKTMKRVYGTERSRKRILIDTELRTIEKLQKIKEKIILSERKSERIKAVTVNPFLAVMYKNMSFKAWFNIYRTNLPRRQDEKEYQLERDSSDEELDSNRVLSGQVNDDEYEYLTDQDLSCHSDDDYFEMDNSQKHLLQERSINALINDINGITPIAPLKLDSKRGGDYSTHNTNNVMLNFTDKAKFSYQRTMKEDTQGSHRNQIEIDDQSLERHQSSGFKIKLQHTLQQRLESIEDVQNNHYPPQSNKKQHSLKGNDHQNDSQIIFNNDNDNQSESGSGKSFNNNKNRNNNNNYGSNGSQLKQHIQSQFGRAAQQSQQSDRNNSKFYNNNNSVSKSDKDSSSYQNDDDSEDRIENFDKEGTQDKLLLSINNKNNNHNQNNNLQLEDNFDIDEKTPTSQKQQQQQLLQNDKIYNDLMDEVLSGHEENMMQDNNDDRNFDTMDHLKQD